MKKSSLLGAVCALLLAGPGQATTLFDFMVDNSGLPFYGNTLACNHGCTLGYTFDLSSPVAIDGLGVFDLDSDGLNNNHEVGLWNSSGALVASATVLTTSTSVEASASSAGNFVYSSIMELTLNPGTYTVGALYKIGDTDPIVYGAEGIFSNDLAASYGAGKFINTGILSMPDSSSNPTDRYFGAAVHISSVPVPPAIWFFGSGMLALIGTARRKKCG